MKTFNERYTGVLIPINWNYLKSTVFQVSGIRISRFVHVGHYAVDDQGFPRVGGADPPGGKGQHMILP